MSDDTQINTTSTPNTSPSTDAVIDPQILVDEALATTTPPPTPTPPEVPEQIEAPATEELKTAEEEVAEPIPQTKEELPLAFAPNIEKPITQPEQAGIPTPSVVEPVKPVETPPPVNESKKKGKGGKILLTVLGFFLLVSSVVGGYFIYQQQFGETAKIAEVAGICNDNTITAAGCRGEAVGHEFCPGYGETRKMYCFSTTDGNCGRDYVVPEDNSCGGAGPSSIPGTACTPSKTCVGGTRTWEGRCALYYCPNGHYVANKCGDNDPGVQITFGDCSSKRTEAESKPVQCWQLDHVDNNNVYCEVPGCSDVVVTSGCGDLLSPPPSSNPSPSPSPRLSPSPSPRLSPSPSPRLSPSPSPSTNTTVACTSLTKNKTDSQIKIGTTITFTCAGETIASDAMGGSSGDDTGNKIFPISYSYRIRKDGGAWQNLITILSSGTPGEIATYTINSAGNYRAQCRACITVLEKKICNPVWNSTPPGGTL